MSTRDETRKENASCKYSPPRRFNYPAEITPVAPDLLKISGEPGRTRTYNPLIKSQLLYH